MHRKKSNGCWSKERIDEYFQKMISENKPLTKEEFRKGGSGGYLFISQGKYDPAITTWNQFLKFKTNMINQKDKGVWKDINYVLSELHKFMEEQGLDVLPSHKKFVDSGYSCLSFAISRYHGGIRKIREILGQENKRKEDGKWSDLEYTLEQTRLLIKDHPECDDLPNVACLLNAGRSDIYYAIVRYHGGFNDFRKNFGLQPTRVKEGTWKNKEYVFEISIEFFKSHPEYDELPSQKTLINLGFRKLQSAISKYHGGFPAYREKLREYMGQKNSKQQGESLLEEWVNE